MSTCEDHREIALVLIGDSDISRWPPELYPSIPINQHEPTSSLCHATLTTVNFAKGGAIMENLPKQIQKSLKEISEKRFDTTVFIACAGENDVSSNIPMNEIISSLVKSIEKIFSKSSSRSNQTHLIFIGPKIEPWMTEDELDARTKYFQLSHRLKQSFQMQKQGGERRDAGDPSSKNLYSFSSTACNDRESVKKSIFYIDCLTIFCGESKDLSVSGGKAIADKKYFDADELHLSHEGYELLQREVRKILGEIL